MADSLAGPVDFTVPVQVGHFASHAELRHHSHLRRPVAALERRQIQVRPRYRQQRDIVGCDGSGQDETDELGRIGRRPPGRGALLRAAAAPPSPAGSQSGR